MSEPKEKAVPSADLQEGKVKKTSRKKTPKVTVTLRVKQLVRGKRGFLGPDGTTRLLGGMEFAFGEQEVSEDIWNDAEVYTGKANQ